MTVSRRDQRLTHVWDSIDQLDAVRRAASLAPFGTPRFEANPRVFAAIGDLVIVDTSSSVGKVFLPLPGQRDAPGACIGVVNKGNYNLTVFAPAGALIDNAESKEIAPGERTIFLYQKRGLWVDFISVQTTDEDGEDPTGKPYLTTAMPAGMSPPEALYQFDGSGSALTDRTGNGHTLSVVSGGTARYITEANGRVGFFFGSDTALQSAVGRTGLAITGGLTVEILMATHDFNTSAAMPIIGFGAQDSGAEAEANNWLYWLGMSDPVSSFGTYHSVRGMRYRHEYSTGTEEAHNLLTARMIVNRNYLVTLTRNSAATSVSVYLNGALVQTVTPSNAPTGGGSSRLWVMGHDDPGSLRNTATAYCVRISDEQMTAAQVLEASNTVVV